MSRKELGTNFYASVTSVIGNYIEAGAASSKKDYANYFTISLKSANESKLWFSLLKDTGRAKPEDVNNFIEELNQISNIFASSILTMKNKK
jgi:four helix bundle protein